VFLSMCGVRPGSPPFPSPTLFRSDLVGGRVGRTLTGRAGAVADLVGGCVGRTLTGRAGAVADLVGGRVGRTLTGRAGAVADLVRSEEHTSELQSQSNLVCRLLLEK